MKTRESKESGFIEDSRSSTFIVYPVDSLFEDEDEDEDEDEEEEEEESTLNTAWASRR